MPFRHPQTQVHVFDAPFTFLTPYRGRAESIPRLEIGYETWGDPTHPAVLICHPLSGNAHCTDTQDPDDPKRSWWNCMVGPGRPIDTNCFFVICVNMLGSCMGSSGPASVNPDTGQPYGLHFPAVTVHDMVITQRRLLQALGIEHLHAVVGGSMGGFQALVWGILYPEWVDRILGLATCGASSQFMIMTNRSQIDAIQSDANYREGHYHQSAPPEAGLAIAREIGFTTFISPRMMEQKFAKAHQSLREPFIDGYFKEQIYHEAESYLRRQGETFGQRFDANSMVYLLQTWNHFDLARKYGTLARAFAGFTPELLLISATGDNLFPPYLSENIVEAMAANDRQAQHVIIDDDYGHDFFLIGDLIQTKISEPVSRFLTKNPPPPANARSPVFVLP